MPSILYPTEFEKLWWPPISCWTCTWWIMAYDEGVSQTKTIKQDSKMRQPISIVSGWLNSIYLDMILQFRPLIGWHLSLDRDAAESCQITHWLPQNRWIIYCCKPSRTFRVRITDKILVLDKTFKKEEEAKTQNKYMFKQKKWHKGRDHVLLVFYRYLYMAPQHLGWKKGRRET